MFCATLVNFGNHAHPDFLPYMGMLQWFVCPGMFFCTRTVGSPLCDETIFKKYRESVL